MLVEEKSAALELKAKELLFLELTQVSLWGNATDLSLLIDVRIIIATHVSKTDSIEF